jgi:hypothetical protein
VTFCSLNRAGDRVVCLLAVGFVWSICAPNAPVAKAAWSPASDLREGSRAQTDSSASVEAVRRILADDSGKSDAEVAKQLSGKKSLWALMALADASAFLAPPAADVLSQAPPDLSEQRRMMVLTVDYLGKTLPKLPNFYATRTTIRFDGDVNLPRIGLHRRAASQEDSSWRRVGSSEAIVVYRDGKEVVDPQYWGKHPSRPEGGGLITKGTFGSIPLTVIVDAAHGETAWDHWERGAAGTLAVFRYRVAENQSHYSVTFRGRSSENAVMEQVTGYHGEVAIDPVTGTILRLTVEADLPFGSPIVRGDIMVEYGPVEIGGRTYMCPVRSVSISLTLAGLMGGRDAFGHPVGNPEATLLNDVTFKNYHQFRSTSRILTGSVPAPDH